MLHSESATEAVLIVPPNAAPTAQRRHPLCHHWTLPQSIADWNRLERSPLSILHSMRICFSQFSSRWNFDRAHFPTPFCGLSEIPEKGRRPGCLVLREIQGKSQIALEENEWRRRRYPPKVFLGCVREVRVLRSL